MEVKLKVCGMRDAENLLSVAALRPDYMGFIFYQKSPRFVGEDFQVPKSFPADIKKVGVFVNETPEKMLAIARMLQLDYLQLHGNESVEVCATIKQAGIGVIKVFSVGDDFDFAVTKPYQSSVDFFLFDTKGKYYGGNAQVFDWTVLNRYDQQIPFFLSGGITPDNVINIASLRIMNLHALDVNSGVEIQPALKSVEKLNTLITQVSIL
jgi:phosphoribosylanthranilate isomerase